MKNVFYQIEWLVSSFFRRWRYKGFFAAWDFLLFNIRYSLRWRWLICLLARTALFPSSVEIEISTTCSIRCRMCELTYWDEPARLMKLEEFRHIVGQFTKLRWIAMTGIGENFLNKEFLDMYRYTKKKWPHIYIELYDMFYFIDEKMSRALIEEIQIDRVFVSFDAATKQTYEQLRPGSRFERVLENIERFIRIKKERKLYYPEIRFHFVINKLNFSEIFAYIDLISHIRQGEEVGIHFTRMLHCYNEVKDMFVEIPAGYIKEVEEKGKKSGINIVWNADVPSQKPEVGCCANWQMPFIFVTGEVIPCCAMNEANARPLQRAHSLGNVFKEDLRAIWSGQAYRELRKSIPEGRVPDNCFNCPMFVGKRKT